MEPTQEAQVLEIGEFRVDAQQRVLLAADGTRVPLSSRAFELLLFFARHPGELLDKDRLMKAAWPNTVVEENNLNQNIGAIRKALGETPGQPRFLVNEPGRGYRFVAAVTVAGASPPAAPKRRWPWVVVLAGALVLVAAALWMSRQRAAPVTDRSIAVLPFENRSAARENGYLALGIQDEILTLLTRIGSLRVVPRTSTVKFSDAAIPATDIGRELGVAYLLQGSVQRAGERIRVNVTLIDTRLDRHQWASSYDSNANEIFAVESQVARDVALVLQARLTAEEQKAIAAAPTNVPAAYDAYLRAKAFAERTTRTEAEIHQAIEAYEQAVRLDPDFAAAWSQLSRRNANLYSLSYDRSVDRREAARQALAQTESLAPGRMETLAARGYFKFVVEADLEGSLRVFKELEARYPDNADPLAGIAQVLRELGQQDASDEYSRRTLARDRRNPYRHAIICQDFLTAREFEVAEKTCARALELLPGDIGIIALQATIHQARGELDQSRALLRTLVPAPGDWRSLRVMSRQMLLDRDYPAAVGLLTRYLEDAGALGTRSGFVRRWLGDAQRLAGSKAEALDSYQRAAQDLEAELARQRENPLLTAELAIVQARRGERGAASELAQRCAELAARGRRDSMAAECALAAIQVELATGAPADAVQRLKAASTLRGELPPLTPALLRLDPEFDALRARKDFQSLM